MHLIIIEKDNQLKTILPEQNLGPSYNHRRYGRGRIPKGNRAYKTKANVKKALTHNDWYDGSIVFDSDDQIIWMYDTEKLPDEVTEMRASIFIKLVPNAIARCLGLVKQTKSGKE